MNERVSFLVAGAQKAGTSALFEYLREVPDLQLPDIKEAHVFDDERIDWAAPDLTPYHALFADDGRLRGEATPIYLYWPNSLERARAYNPEMRIIVLLRDPVERAWSHWKMEYAKRKETEPFAWCIREGRARVAAGDPAAPGHHRVFSYVERGFYGAQLERLYGLFPRDQISLLRSGDLSREPDTVVSQICSFLAVPALTAPLTRRRVREAAAIPYPSDLTEEDRAYLTAIYADDTARFAALTGLDLSS